MQQRIANKETKLIEIELDDIKEFFSATRDKNFLERVVKNTTRYVDLFASIIDQNMPKPSVNFREEDLTRYDLIMEQRRFNN